MFTKVLIAEDLDSIGFAISKMLEQEFAISNTTIFKYCNEALLSIKSEALKKQPYDLIITDISFKEDYRDGKIRTGQELIRTVKNIYPQMPIIVFTVEDNPNIAQPLLSQNQPVAYVLKGRDGFKQLKQAITKVAKGLNYVSNTLQVKLKSNPVFEIENYDVVLLQELSKGLSQAQISVAFKNKDTTPSSLSSIEKRLNKLKDILKAKNNVQLVANAKDLGLI